MMDLLVIGLLVFLLLINISFIVGIAPFLIRTHRSLCQAEEEIERLGGRLTQLQERATPKQHQTAWDLDE